jgi:hypothetical protein
MKRHLGWLYITHSSIFCNYNPLRNYLQIQACLFFTNYMLSRQPRTQSTPCQPFGRSVGSWIMCYCSEAIGPLSARQMKTELLISLLSPCWSILNQVEKITCLGLQALAVLLHDKSWALFQEIKPPKIHLTQPSLCSFSHVAALSIISCKKLVP